MGRVERKRAYLDCFATPIGELAIIADDDGALCAVGFTNAHARMERCLREGTIAGSEVVRAVDPFSLRRAFEAYFAGEFAAIEGLRVAMTGTPFQFEVWTELRRIPRGSTISYGELARRIGRDKAVRAVGLANGANPVGIVVPCHRVIGSNARLTGYGGGVDRKRWLLEHEGAAFAAERQTTGRIENTSTSTPGEACT